MKKTGAILAAGALAGFGFYKFHEWVFNALIDRDFKVPEALGHFMTESENKDKEEKERVYKENMNWLLDYGFERHYMINDRGQKLVGYLMKPNKESKVYVFGSHGYRSNGKGEWCYYAKHYVEELGFNLFFVDHQAAGESEGQYIGFSSFESRDSLRWLRYMNDTFGEDIEIILHGISMGSTTVMLMSGNDKLPSNVKFTIADCGFTSALDEFTYKMDSLKLPAFPMLPMVKAIHEKKVGYDFQKDTNALGAVANAKVPMFFVHGGNDKFVPTFMAPKLYDACNAEYKDILIVEGADHAMSYREGKEDYEKKIDEFIDKFIESKVL